MRRRRLFDSAGAVVVCLLLATLGSCGSSSSSGTSNSQGFHLITPGTLTMGYTVGAPDALINSKGNLVGLVPSMLHTFANEHHLKVHPVRYSFAGLIAAVETGRIDISGEYYYTTERAMHVYYTEPYENSGAYMIVDKSFKYDGPQSLQGKTVGVATGFAEVPYLIQTLGNSNVLQLSDDADGVEAVETGRVVAYVSASGLGYYTTRDKSLKLEQITTGQFGMPASVTEAVTAMFVNCSNKGLAKAVDSTMDSMRSNGQMREIFTEYANPQLIEPKQMPKQLCTA